MIQYELRSGVGRITLAAAESGNTLDGRLARDVMDALARANAESECRAVVLQAIGPDFCRGMSFDGFLLTSGDPNGMLLEFADCLAAISASPKPVIAAIDGTVIGGGVGLASACDMVLATPASTFSLPEVIVGMVPGLIAPHLLRRMPLARVRYLALSCRPIAATEAFHAGLVDELATDGIEVAVNAHLRRLFRASPMAVAEVKRYFDRLSPEFDTQRMAAAAELKDWLRRPGVVEGVSAFAEGFTPPWFAKYREGADGRKHPR
jgi:methylglutaconyl-CoA hydratase/polyketide biosynthesis enoyl-CoA hydratase PksH